jgi:hypothetical protein
MSRRFSVLTADVVDAVPPGALALSAFPPATVVADAVPSAVSTGIVPPGADRSVPIERPAASRFARGAPPRLLSTAPFEVPAHTITTCARTYATGASPRMGKTPTGPL